MRVFRHTVVCLLLLPSLALPCGPDFPLEYLAHRDETLATLPDGAFLFEAPRLVAKPAETLPIVEQEPEGARDGGGPMERALYAAASKAWQANRPTSGPKFEAVLKLPEAERRRFTIPAHYALAILESDDAKAATHYAAIREAQKSGFEDVFGLTVSTYGQQAQRALWLRDDATAVRLYAQEASYGSTSGATSLLFVARQLATDQERLQTALREPLVQQLMSLYAWTRSAETWQYGEDTHAPSANLLTTLSAVPNLAGSDRLAAALYRAGKYEDAAKFVTQPSTPLAHWVASKLAIRLGHLDDAEKELLAARTGFELTESWATPYAAPRRPRQQIEVELSALALSRGDFDGAMTHALTSCSWLDVSYLAERVLTLDELTTRVDALGTKPSCATPAPTDESDDPTAYWLPRDQTQALRSLLARRLVRTANFTRALPYFADDVRPLAEKYVAAMLAAQAESKPLKRAALLNDAANALRGHGMEVLGTEVAPDWAWTRGAFDPTWGEPSDAGVPPAEAQRVAQSAPAFAHRFHYRLFTSKLFEDAANLVPPRSQAFAALLCASARSVIDLEPPRATALWQRYVKQGALLMEPMEFGRQCPEPDFTPKPFKWPKVRKRTIALAAAPVMALVVLFVVARRRRVRV